MGRLAMVLGLCALMTSCTLIDMGVGRGTDDWNIDGGGNAYAEMGWPSHDKLLTVDVVGGANSGALISAHLWRLLNFEVGILGAAIGIGPIQLGAGFLAYDPMPPAMMEGNNIFE